MHFWLFCILFILFIFFLVEGNMRVASVLMSVALVLDNSVDKNSLIKTQVWHQLPESTFP